MRLAKLDVDFWELESGEVYHQQFPDTFWLPPKKDRNSLRRGQLAKLIFKIEVERDGEIEFEYERMWVLVTEKVRSYFIGRLGFLTKRTHSA